jgi:hypothetical protein
MLHSKVYYHNENNGYSDFFRGFGLVMGPLVASNLLVCCPQFSNKFAEMYIIGLSTSFMFTSYLNINNKYLNTFWSDFKNSFFITMSGSLVYIHPLFISTEKYLI